MLAQYLDLTEEIQANGFAIVEASNYDYCVAQLIGMGDATFSATLDSGAVQSVTDGNALLSTSYSTVVATNLIDGTFTSAPNTDGLYRFDVVGRYIKITTTANKLLIMLAKIS